MLPTNESKLKRVSQARLSQVTQSIRSDIYTAEILTGHSLITLRAVQMHSKIISLIKRKTNSHFILKHCNSFTKALTHSCFLSKSEADILTVNSPVTASKPTWMVCSKSDGGEISGLSFSFFLLPEKGVQRSTEQRIKVLLSPFNRINPSILQQLG